VDAAVVVRAALRNANARAMSDVLPKRRNEAGADWWGALAICGEMVMMLGLETRVCTRKYE